MATQPTEPAPFAGQYLVDGVPQCAHPGARCEPCQFGQHPGGNHTWANLEDVVHALRTGQPDPANQKCDCFCVDEPEHIEPEPDFDEVTFSDLEPCPVCGEHGACGYDADGRPMVHTDAFDRDDEEDD